MGGTAANGVVTVGEPAIRIVADGAPRSCSGGRGGEPRP